MPVASQGVVASPTDTKTHDARVRDSREPKTRQAWLKCRPDSNVLQQCGRQRSRCPRRGSNARRYKRSCSASCGAAKLGTIVSLMYRNELLHRHVANATWPRSRVVRALVTRLWGDQGDREAAAESLGYGPTQSHDALCIVSARVYQTSGDCEETCLARSVSARNWKPKAPSSRSR